MNGWVDACVIWQGRWWRVTDQLVNRADETVLCLEDWYGSGERMTAPALYVMLADQ